MFVRFCSLLLHVLLLFFFLALLKEIAENSKVRTARTKTSQQRQAPTHPARMESGQDQLARKRPCTRNGQHPSSPPSKEGRTLQQWRCFLGLGPRESCHKIHKLRAPSASDFHTHNHQAVSFGVQEFVILPFLIQSGSEQHRTVCVSCVGAR